MKLKKFSVIVLIDLDASLDISQQWQFSIFISLKFFFNQKNSWPRNYASSLSQGKNSSFSQLHFFLQETLINIKTTNHQEHIFHRTRSSSYFCLVNIVKILRTDFLYTSRSSRLQMSFKIGVLKSSANFSGKYLCRSLFLKKLSGSRPETLF